MSTRPSHPRQSSVDQQTSQQLEGKLLNRPDKAALIERNILKDDKGLAPSLVAAKEKLQRSQLEAPIPLTTVSPADCAPKDQLANAIAARPPREELEKSGILKGPEEEQAPASA